MNRRLQAALGLLVLAAAADVRATTVRRLGTEELVHEAERIVIGRPVEWKTSWVERTLVTLVTVEVRETLKGEAAERVTVALPGGIDAKRKFPISVNYAGAPTLAPREDVVLFLVGDQDFNAYSIAGFSQGKFSIVEDSGGTKVVSRDLTQVQVQDVTGVGRGTRTFQPLSEFVTEIRGHLSRER